MSRNLGARLRHTSCFPQMVQIINRYVKNHVEVVKQTKIRQAAFRGVP